MHTDYDVVVIGAGFAGATAARECAARGLRTLVLEARDRIGGRTWSTQLSSGEIVEIGGTFVHWSQPHVWSEITRYNLTREVVPGADEPEWALLPTGAGMRWSRYADHAEREKALLERVFSPSRRVLPQPYNPLCVEDAVAEFDRMTLRDRLDQLNLSAEDDAYLSAMFCTESSNSTEEGSFLSLMRWWAAAGHTYEGMEESVFAYKLATGTVTLLQAIISDGGAEVRLNSPVLRVDRQPTHVSVTTADGLTVSAATVVVATPIGIWPRIDFVPALSENRLAAAHGGMQAPRGAKIIAVLRGEKRRFYAQAPVGHPIGFMWTAHFRSADEQVVVIFSGPTMNNPGDPEELAAGVRDLLPGTEIVESMAGTYLEGDEFSNGGWAFLRPGQLTRFSPHVNFTKPEGRLVFATSDIASAWCGLIDGAIESGLHAGRQAREILAADQ